MQLVVNEVEVDAKNNQSKIDWSVSIYGTEWYWYSSTLTLTINGVELLNTPWIDPPTEKFPMVAGTKKTGSMWIAHDSDGSKKINCSFMTAIYYRGESEHGGSVTLSDIDRSAPSVSMSIGDRGVNSIKISASSNVDCNSWDYSIDDGSTWTNFSTTKAKSRTYTIEGLAVNTTYKIKVRARKASNNVYGSTTSIDASTLGMSAGTDIAATMGQVVNISWTRYNDAFTHTLTYKFGSASGTICTGAATSYLWAIPLDLASQIPGAVSDKGTYTIYTYDGTTLIGSNTYELTLSVPDSVVPSFSFSLSEGTASGFNRYVQGLSTLRAILETAGVYGSTVKTAQLIVQGTTYEGKVRDNVITLNSNVLQLEEESEVVLIITDSRDRTAIKTAVINVYGYYKPQVEDIEFDITGTTAKIRAIGNVAPVNDINQAFVTVKKKRVSDQTETTVVSRIALIQLPEQQKYILNHQWTLTISDIQTESYEFIVILEDLIKETEYSEQTGIVTASYYAGGKGFRLFGEAYQEGFMVGDIDYTLSNDEFDAVLGRTVDERRLVSLLRHTARQIIDIVYPTGSIYTTDDENFNPNEKWSGTWTLIQSNPYQWKRVPSQYPNQLFDLLGRPLLDSNGLILEGGNE